jgi:hypothetical protein
MRSDAHNAFIMTLKDGGNAKEVHLGRQPGRYTNADGIQVEQRMEYKWNSVWSIDHFCLGETSTEQCFFHFSKKNCHPHFWFKTLPTLVFYFLYIGLRRSGPAVSQCQMFPQQISPSKLRNPPPLCQLVPLPRPRRPARSSSALRTPPAAARPCS